MSNQINKVNFSTVTVNSAEYHVIDWVDSYHNRAVLGSITELLSAHEVQYWHVGKNQVFTTKDGIFHIQMELINLIQA